MRRALVVATAITLSVSALSVLAGDGEKKGTDGKCICPSKTPATVAWCDPCGGGVAYGHKTKSQKLITALAGKQVDSKSISCTGCKTAAENDANCDHCRVGFFRGMAYHSPVSTAMARGTVVEADKVNCPTCRTGLEKGKGFCSGCNAGIVAGMVYSSEENYNSAKKANTILAKSVNKAKSCEGCAVAMVSDDKCSGCNVAFKDGKLVKSKKKGGY